jgi:hypothetical protein
LAQVPDHVGLVELGAAGEHGGDEGHAAAAPDVSHKIEYGRQIATHPKPTGTIWGISEPVKLKPSTDTGYY